jgi:hypothetical protein
VSGQVAQAAVVEQGPKSVIVGEDKHAEPSGTVAEQI